MTSLPFTKMHGCGNDYVFIDAWRSPVPGDPALLARRLSDRHMGVGADGLIVVGPSAQADLRMQMFNADGTESEMCGNGLRCAAKLVHDHGHVQGASLRAETGAGVLDVTLHLDGGRCHGASIRMGAPRLQPDAVPVLHPGPGPVLALDASVAGATFALLAVGMGNPHAVCFLSSVEDLPLDAIGPAIEHDPRFPRRTNVEMVCRLPDEGGVPVLRQRTWERGSGETLACGTGACATLVAAVLSKRIPGREAIIRLTGGDLRVSWPSADGTVTLSGPARTVYTGVWPLDTPV